MKVHIFFLIATILAVDALPADDFDIEALKQCLKRNQNVVDFTFPYKSDCTLYYLCEGDEPKIYACQSGFHYNKDLGVCDIPEKAGCAEFHSIIPISDSSENENAKSSGGSSSSGCIDKSSGSSSSSSELSGCSDESSSSSSSSFESSGCSDESSSSASSSSSESCDSKSSGSDSSGCSNESSDSSDSSDSSSSSCDDSNGDCSNGSIETTYPTRPTPTSTTPGSSPTIPTTPTPTTPTTSTITTPRCPDDNNTPTYYPHDSDCHKFYQCDWGKLVEHECPLDNNGERLVFNPILNVCDWYDSAVAAGAICSSTPTSSTSTPTPATRSTPSTITTTPNITSGECPEDNSYYHSFPHPTDCTKFYVCDWGTPILKDCPAGLHFNPVLMVCDWPNVAGCGSGGTPSTPTTPTTTSEAVCSCPKDDKYYACPHEDDCTRCYICELGLQVLHECKDGLFYNKETMKCDVNGKCDIDTIRLFGI